MRSKPKANLPPTPQPDLAKSSAPATAPPEEPLSVPQTNVRLPSPQPISTEALATIQAPRPKAPERNPESTPPPAAAQPARRTQPGAAPPPSNLPAPEEPARPRIRPIMPADERRQMDTDLENRRREINDLLARIAARKLSDEERNSVSRIQSFLDLSDRARKRGDMRQAATLSERALLLARDLQRAGQ